MHIENVDDNIVDNIYLHQQQQQQQQQEYSMKSMDNDNFVKNKEQNDNSMFDDDDDDNNVKLSNNNVDNVVDNNNNSAKENQNLIPCTLCQRKFLSDRLVSSKLCSCFFFCFFPLCIFHPTKKKHFIDLTQKTQSINQSINSGKKNKKSISYRTVFFVLIFQIDRAVFSLCCCF